MRPRSFRVQVDLPHVAQLGRVRDQGVQQHGRCGGCAVDVGPLTLRMLPMASVGETTRSRPR
jgi:hypothetical protein